MKPYVAWNCKEENHGAFFGVVLLQISTGDGMRRYWFMRVCGASESAEFQRWSSPRLYAGRYSPEYAMFSVSCYCLYSPGTTIFKDILNSL